MNSTETATFDLPLPSRNFAATRRMLLIVLAGSILIPLACLAVYGYYDYQRRMANANDLIERLARVANEHAVKVIDLNQQLVTRIVDMLGDSDDAQHRAPRSCVASHARRDRRRLSAGRVDLCLRRERRPAREQPLLSGAARLDRASARTFRSARAMRPSRISRCRCAAKVAQIGRVHHDDGPLGRTAGSSSASCRLR